MSRVFNSEKILAADIFQLNQVYYEKGWTDGLPILPPTAEKIWEMLDYVGLEPHAVLGRVPERSREVTAEKLAINAVMAGCLPEYMPVLLAVVEAMTDPAFGIHGLAATTGGASPRASA